MYDENNVPGPEYKVRPVVRYLVTVFFHGYMTKDQHGYPLEIQGSSRVIGEFEREDHADDVKQALQKRSDDFKSARLSAGEEPEMVPGEPEDMAEALTQISSELGCQNNLEDILHAIDALKVSEPA